MTLLAFGFSRAAAIFVAVLLCGFSYNNSVFTTDGSSSDVQAANNAASNGCSIVIPSGTFSWATTVSISNAITLSGGGTNATIIQDSPTATTPVLAAYVPVTGLIRVTGIQFAKGTRGTDGQVGAILATGDNRNAGRIRVDNCYFNNLSNRSCIFVESAIGVCDSCYFIFNPGSGNRFAFDIRGSLWGGLSNGDGSWTNGPNFGTDLFWYIEDCYTTNTGSIFEMIDCYYGARFVLRHTTNDNTRVATHGTESTGRPRSHRACEIWANYFRGDGVNSEFVSFRGGTGLFYSNTLANWNTSFNDFAINARAFRSTDTLTPWQGAQGTNAWDSNSVANPILSGTASSGGTLSMTDSGKSWTANQWTGYSIRNLTTSRFSCIKSNTATTIYYTGATFVGDMTFSASDSYEIDLIHAVLDQPGMGAGDVINISSPAWPNEVIEKAYAWQNIENGTTDANIGSLYTTIRPGLHFTNGVALAGYAGYIYPHPLRSAALPSPVIPGILNVSGRLNVGQIIKVP